MKANQTTSPLQALVGLVFVFLLCVAGLFVVGMVIGVAWKALFAGFSFVVGLPVGNGP